MNIRPYQLLKRELTTATKEIYEAKFDLIVIDLMMPLRDNEDPQDISEDVISVLELSTLNGGASIIALSGFDTLVQEQRQRFTKRDELLVTLWHNKRAVEEAYLDSSSAH